jgi:hypothetical protein
MMILTYLKIGGVVALVLGLYGAGWKTRDAFCDAAKAKQEVSELKLQIKARDKAATEDTVQFVKDQAEIAELEQKVSDAKANVGRGECLSAPDTDGLRRLWEPRNPRAGSK